MRIVFLKVNSFMVAVTLGNHFFRGATAYAFLQNNGDVIISMASPIEFNGIVHGKSLVFPIVNATLSYCGTYSGNLRFCLFSGCIVS